jgi:uncharacterized protein
MVDAKVFQQTPVMPPQEVAEIGYRALMRGDRNVVPGGSNKALVFARRFMTKGAQARINKKFYEDAKPAKRKRRPGEIQRKAQRERDEKHLSE